MQDPSEVNQLLEADGRPRDFPGSAGSGCDLHPPLRNGNRLGRDRPIPPGWLRMRSAPCASTSLTEQARRWNNQGIGTLMRMGALMNLLVRISPLAAIERALEAHASGMVKCGECQRLVERATSLGACGTTSRYCSPECSTQGSIDNAW